MFDQIDVSGDKKIDYKEFVAMLKLMDRSLKSLPATAQVASQQVSPPSLKLPFRITYDHDCHNIKCPHSFYWAKAVSMSGQF